MITHRRRRVHQLMSGSSHHIKISNLERNALLAANRSAERGALQRILRRQLQAGPDASQCQGSDGDPAVVQDRQELLKALASLAQQMIFGNPDVSEGQRMGVGGVPAELGVARTNLETRCPDGHDDRRDLRLAVLPGAGARGNGAQRA